MCASLGLGGAGAATTAPVTGTSAAPAVLASPVSASRTLTATTNGPDCLEVLWRLSSLGSLRGMFGSAPEAAGEGSPGPGEGGRGGRTSLIVRGDAVGK